MLKDSWLITDHLLLISTDLSLVHQCTDYTSATTENKQAVQLNYVII